MKKLRFFILYKIGKLVFYNTSMEQKGTLIIGPNSNVRKIEDNEIMFNDGEKSKPYKLQPPSTS